MTKHLLTDVFTPSVPARLCFVERSQINRRLANAIQTPGRQIVIYGHSGSGKSTVITNKLYQLYENHITTRCMTGMTFEQVVLDAFDQLSPYYTSEKSSAKKTQISGSVGSSYVGIKSQISSQLETQSGEKSERYLPPQLTPQNLSKFIGEAKCCWVLEDFHKLESSEKPRLSQTMKVFMDQAVDYKDLKIIAIGAVDTARQVIDYDNEMKNRVAEVLVPLMSDDEISEILKKGESLLNIKFDEKVLSSIVEYSNGIASTCHAIALACCQAVGIVQTSDECIQISMATLEEGLSIYIEESADTLKSSFDKALTTVKKTKYDNFRIVIEALSSYAQQGIDKASLHSKVSEKYPDYPASNISYCLSQLQTEARGKLVRFDSTSKLYSFADPVYRAFALAYFKDYNARRPSQMDLPNLDTTRLLEDVNKQILTLLSKWEKK